MVSSTYTGYIQSALSYQWNYFFNFSAVSFLNTNGAGVNLGSAVYLSYAGAGAAFVLSVLGAYDNLTQTIKYVDDSMHDFLIRYGQGKFDQIMDSAKMMELMEGFLNDYTWDLIIYTAASFIHSAILISVGTIAAFWIFNQIRTQMTATADWATIPVKFGWKYMLFGVMVGTVDYFAGNIAKNIVDEVLLSIGFRDHQYASDDVNKTTNIAKITPEGVSTEQITETYGDTFVHYDYIKLLKMQEAWSNFFGLQRLIQLMTPYLLLGALEFGVTTVLGVFILYTI